MLVFLFSLVISLACFWFGFKLIRLYLNLKSWIKTEATILSKSVELHKKYSTRSAYAVRVEYVYRYDGKQYKGNKVYLAELIGGQTNHMKSNAEKIVEKLPEKPEIFVNPKNPEQAVIYCEGIILYIIVFLMGLVSLFIGISYL